MAKEKIRSRREDGVRHAGVVARMWDDILVLLDVLVDLRGLPLRLVDVPLRARLRHQHRDTQVKLAPNSKRSRTKPYTHTLCAIHRAENHHNQAGRSIT